MMPKPELTFSEVPAPDSMWCEGFNNGHRAPDEWEREGAGTGMQRTRFFQATGKDVNMKVCELCMTVAHWMAAQEKKGRP